MFLVCILTNKMNVEQQQQQPQMWNLFIFKKPFYAPAIFCRPVERVRKCSWWPNFRDSDCLWFPDYNLHWEFSVNHQLFILDTCCRSTVLLNSTHAQNKQVEATTSNSLGHVLQTTVTACTARFFFSFRSSYGTLFPSSSTFSSLLEL